MVDVLTMSKIKKIGGTLLVNEMTKQNSDKECSNGHLDGSYKNMAANYKSNKQAS